MLLKILVLAKKQLNRHSKKGVLQQLFNKIDTRDKAYVMGFICGDGDGNIISICVKIVVCI